MPQDTTEHRPEGSATSSTRRCDGTCAQEERLEMQKRAIAQAERLVEMQRKNLALEEQLLEWQKKSLAQDERLLEIQKRAESLGGKQTDIDAREKAEAKLKDADARIKELEIIVQDLQVSQSSTNMPPSYTQSITTTTTTTPMDSKAAKTVSPCPRICEKKQELLRVCGQMQINERLARDALARLKESIQHTQDQDKFLNHHGVVKDLEGFLENYQVWERTVQKLCLQHGGCIGGATDEVFQNLSKHNEEGRKTIEDAIEEARQLVGPPDLNAIARQSPRSEMVLALGCRH
jgi:hypothetical protein